MKVKQASSLLVAFGIFLGVGYCLVRRRKNSSKNFEDSLIFWAGSVC